MSFFVHTLILLVGHPLQNVDVEGEGATDGKLDFAEFCTLFDKLSERPELKSLFSLYSSKYEWLTVRDLQRFLQIEQGKEGRANRRALAD